MLTGTGEPAISNHRLAGKTISILGIIRRLTQITQIFCFLRGLCVFSVYLCVPLLISFRKKTLQRNKLIFLFFIIFLFTSCPNRRAESAARDDVYRQVPSQQANLPFVGPYVAQAKGFFAEEGLSVTIEHSAGGGRLTFGPLGKCR